jgi:hypothetical protein
VTVLGFGGGGVKVVGVATAGRIVVGWVVVVGVLLMGVDYGGNSGGCGGFGGWRYSASIICLTLTLNCFKLLLLHPLLTHTTIFDQLLHNFLLSLIPAADLQTNQFVDVLPLRGYRSNGGGVN